MLKELFDNILDILHAVLIFVNTIFFLKGPNPDNKIKCCELIIYKGVHLFEFYMKHNTTVVKKSAYLKSAVLQIQEQLY